MNDFPLSQLRRRKFLQLMAGVGAVGLLGSRWSLASSSTSSVEAILAGVNARKARLIEIYALEATIKDEIGSRAHDIARGIAANSWHNLFYVIPQLEWEKRHPGEITELSGATKYFWPRSFEFINRFADCSDFIMNAVVRMLYLYPDSPLLQDGKLDEMKNAVLNFVYWDDEAVQHKGVMFTENHQIIFSTAELLAGQLFPDETFTHIADTGKARVQRATPRILRWLDWRARLGFSEWLSNHYYEEDLIALFNLAQFAENEEIRTKAEKLIHLMMFEIATNSIDGIFNATQGRIYQSAVLNPSLSFVSPVTWMLFDQGHYDQVMSMSAVSLATSPYVAPDLLVSIAHDQPKEMENIQRCSLDFEEAKGLGIDPEDPKNYPLFAGAGMAGHPDYVDFAAGFLPAGSRHQSEAQNKARFFSRPGSSQEFEEIFALTRVQPYTYRTPEYLLSSAQDWRKGMVGYQQHIWTAVLADTAQVFTTGIHPEKASRVSRWAGNGSLPRAMAHRNVLIAIYNIADNDRSQRASHAWFPRFAFDEVVEEGSWIFGRKGEGYVGLYSLVPGTWLEPDNEFLSRVRMENPSSLPYDYLVDSMENVWVCQLGNASEFGDFSKFVSSVSKAPIGGTKDSFRYQSPNLGEITAGWEAPMVVAGQTIDLRPEKRFNNPYCQADFNQRDYRIAFQGRTLDLSFTPPSIS